MRRSCMNKSMRMPEVLHGIVVPAGLSRQQGLPPSLFAGLAVWSYGAEVVKAGVHDALWA